ncbi:MAG TPA: ABC transporter permease, partial [Phycisphaerales bacterium]|nr:ABC transporter permease [Phycisphaerales bacterium]
MTFVLEIIRLGLVNLRLHLLRTILTSLGIILGVAAVIVMVAIGEGNKQAALREIQSLGATNIIIRSVKPPESEQLSAGSASFMARYGIVSVDLTRLRAGLPDLSFLVPLKQVGDEITFADHRLTSQAFGVYPALQDAANLRVRPGGRYITRTDLDTKAQVCVIGDQVAQKLFGREDPLDKLLRIKDIVFRVVGVLQPVGLAGGTGSPLVGRDLNFDVHIPYDTAVSQFSDIISKRVAGSFTMEEIQVSEIYATSSSTENVLRDASLIDRIMRVEHPDLKDIKIIVPYELLESARKTALVWSIVFTAIAAISLLVGGIGIMNIML